MVLYRGTQEAEQRKPSNCDSPGTGQEYSTVKYSAVQYSPSISGYHGDGALGSMNII